MQSGNEFELDLLPEHYHYRDEGCDLARSCLKCPFASCVYEESGGKRRMLKRLRAREMATLFTSKGRRIKELADTFGVSRRTVQRALKLALGDYARRGARSNG